MIFTQTFSTKQICRLAKVSAVDLNNLITKQNFPMYENSLGQGRARPYSWQSVYRLCVFRAGYKVLPTREFVQVISESLGFLDAAATYPLYRQCPSWLVVQRRSQDNRLFGRKLLNVGASENLPYWGDGFYINLTAVREELEGALGQSVETGA